MEDAYAVLTEKFGYTDSERLTKVLRRLMDEEEAEVVTSLPCSVSDLAQKFGKSEETVNERLDGLFSKGVIFMTSKGYQVARDITQLHDATGGDIRLDELWGRELLDLWEDFCQAELYPERGRKTQTQEMPTWRVIPARKAISEKIKLLPSEDLEVMLDKATKFAVVHCPCRRIAERCELPVEVCLQLNRSAEYAISRGTGRELTREEAMGILDLSAEAGLIHSAPNRSEVGAVVCNCCTDCCVLYYALIKYGGLERGVAKSRFQAEVDKTTCNGCQVCIERCPFEAIEMVKITGEKKLKAQIDSEKCFGCGVCAVKCDPGAIKLMEVRSPDHIPV